MTIFDGLQPPKVLYEVDSKYNGHIKVIQVGETRKIKVDRIDQSLSPNSPSCTRLVWGKTVDVLKENEPGLKNIMILGLGGGTMAHLISRAYPGVKITSVEIDPVMIDIAKNYFDVDKIPEHRIINEDALRVVIEPDKFGLEEYGFQAVIVDIFVGEKYPDLGKSGNFIAAVKRMVMSGGLIIFNRIYVESHQDDVNLFIDYVSDFLKDVKCLVVAGYTNSDNVLIFGRTQ
jgi:spermidine synthase